MPGGSRLLTGLMVVAALCFGVRFSDLIREVSRAGSIEAYAAQKDAIVMNAIQPAAGEAPPATELKSTNEAPAKPAMPEVKDGEKVPAPGDSEKVARPDIDPPAMDGGAKDKKDWRAAEDLDDEYSDVKIEMFSDLAKRRKDLEAKEKELAMREALLKAAQAELQQKTDELNNIKTDIQSLLKQQTDQENERVASLVKIYEGMKAKDAAKIFNALDMDVLLEVMTRMSERKTGPILAAMDPDKARQVTTMMAEQNKLPDLPTLPLP